MRARGVLVVMRDWHARVEAAERVWGMVLMMAAVAAVHGL